MITRREFIVGGLAGMTVGLVLRCIVGQRIPIDLTQTVITLSPAAAGQSVDIRREVTTPSPEARTAVEAGEVKFIISGRNSNDMEVARILLELGSLPIYQAGNDLCIWKEPESRWMPARTAAEFSGYSIGRAWTLPNPDVLGQAATALPSSAEVFLALPSQEEMRIVSAVEQALRPRPLSAYSRIDLTLEKTPGGHIQWALKRATCSDKTEISPNIILPI